jgi:hypothetical protein
LRKQIKLSSIDEIIDNLSAKTMELKDKAEAFAKKIVEEKKLKEIADTIQKLEKKRLEFPHRTAYKR